jgi:DNA-binding winged helix-turn-helix (wHTH) protein/Flp pilus assembly protein TadD
MAAELVYEFDRFRLDPKEHLLLRDGLPICITQRTYDVLLVLVRNSGHLVEKNRLIGEVWGDAFVEEANLTVTISMLRKALGEGRDNRKLIQTVSKQGYRLMPKADVVARATDPELVQNPTARPIRNVVAKARRLPLHNVGHVALMLSSAAVLVFLLSGAVAWKYRASAMTMPWAATSEASRPTAAVARPETGPVDAEAARLYAEGRYYWNKRTEVAFRHSIECFQQAIVRDPQYAEAYAGLADSYTLLASYGIESPAEAYPNAKAAAAKALTLDAGLADGHTSLGLIALYYEWDWPKAERELSRAIKLNPSSSAAHAWDALYLSAMGKMPQALEQARLARRLDPVSLSANLDLGSVLYWGGRYEEAAATYRHVIALDPYFARVHSRLGMVLAVQRDYAGAIKEFEIAGRLSKRDAYLDGLVGYAEALRGNRKIARRTLTELLAKKNHEYVPAFSLAVLYLGLEDHAHAIEWLAKASEDRSTYLIFATIDPLLDPLRADPAFPTVLERMRLPELPTDNRVFQAANDSQAAAPGLTRTP